VSVQLPPSLERLARSNPIEVDDELGYRPDAQAVLAKILASERARAGRARRRRRGRVLTVVFASLLVGAGAAVAATDPFGFWRSSSPDTALYGVNPSRQVHGSTPAVIRCAPTGSSAVRCGAGLSGQAYQLVDRIQAPSALTRAAITRYLLQSVQRGQLSASGERRVRADLAAVSDTFLARLSEAMRFGTYGGGNGSSVPPPGVPMWLVCEPTGTAIACRDLNGDEDAAVGGGVYMALPAANWVPLSSTGGGASHANALLMTAIFGGGLTPAETRLLGDLATAGTQTTSGGGPTQVSSGSGG
jgi:hypothetical protein